MATTGDTESATTSSTSKHNILTIPLEMFEAIAEQAMPEDPLCLRLVNKETESRVKRTFIKTHLTKRMFLLSDRESLETLLFIAEHKEYGRSLQVLVLCNEELVDPDHVLILNGSSERRLFVAAATGHPMDTKILDELHDREWGRLCEEKQRLLESDGTFRFLTKTFTAFQLHGNTPDLVLADQAEVNMAARGVRTLEGLSAREVIWGEDDDRPVYDPLRAVVSSRFPLTGLKISFANFG